MSCIISELSSSELAPSMGGSLKATSAPLPTPRTSAHVKPPSRRRRLRSNPATTASHHAPYPLQLEASVMLDIRSEPVSALRHPGVLVLLGRDGLLVAQSALVSGCAQGFCRSEQLEQRLRLRAWGQSGMTRVALVETSAPATAAQSSRSWSRPPHRSPLRGHRAAPLPTAERAAAAARRRGVNAESRAQ
eukprot:3540521-Prymnesium_polylepis.2